MVIDLLNLKLLILCRHTASLRFGCRKFRISEILNFHPCFRAFSTVETVESIYANKTGQSPLDLSVQQVIDCDGTDFGCAGGDICSALRWMIFVSFNYLHAG